MNVVPSNRPVVDDLTLMASINRREFLKVGMSSLLGLAMAPVSLTFSQSASAEENLIHRQLRFEIKLTNPKSHELMDQTLWLYGPAAETPTQKLESVHASIPHEALTDRLGHTIIKLAFPQVAPLVVKTVKLVCEVTMTNAPKSTPLANPPDWMNAERFIEIDDPRIRSLASELRQSTESETTKAIYDWLREHLYYAGYIPDDLGALDALIRQKGDCTEYAYLAVALARANGIPARMVGGYVMDRNAVLRADEYHNWAEVYFYGAWRLLDAQKQNWLTPTEQYVAFRFFRDKPINPIGLANRYKLEGDLEVSF